MFRPCALWTVAFLALAAPAAAAGFGGECAGAPRVKTSGAPLGVTARAFFKIYPAARKRCPDALKMDSLGSSICDFTAPDGWTYSLAEDEVFRKELHPERAPLPFGLAATDKFATVMQKIKKAKLRADPYYADGKHGIYVHPIGLPDRCWDETYYWVEFDHQGRLVGFFGSTTYGQ